MGKQCLELRFDRIAGCLRTPEGGSSKQLLIVKKIKDEFSFDTIEYAQNIDDLVQGLHLYIKLKNNTFPVEIQFWTRTDALLNQYLRDSIYTRFNEPDVLDYATNLRTWLEQIPSVPLSKPIKPYVDYLYEKAFQANCVEAD